MGKKVNYDPNIHHRRSIRLMGYDYSRAGLYFITMCVQYRKCLFGKIDAGNMILYDAGKMVERWYYELENKFPRVKCHDMIVMPNHFHCILENTVGADLRVSPEGEHIGSPQPNGSPRRGVSSVGYWVQWFKTMTTNENIKGIQSLGWKPFDKKLWQRDYWEHIIRDYNSFYNIAEYIKNNPAKWENDKLNLKKS